jgi:hypothetical protein
MPDDDAPVELRDLGLQHTQLTAESSRTRTGHVGEPALGFIGDDFQQLFDTPAADRSDNPEIRQLCCSTVLVGTNRMLGLATASQIASASVDRSFAA